MSEPQPITLVDCGCRTHVYNDGSGVEVYYCPLHEAAPKLLAAVKAMLEGRPELWGDQVRNGIVEFPIDETAVFAADEAIREAEQ